MVNEGISNTDKIPKADKKKEEEEEEEEEDEEIVTLKPKTGVKFVVESEEITKAPLELELTLQHPIDINGVQNIGEGLNKITVDFVSGSEKSSKNIENIKKPDLSNIPEGVNQLAEKFVGEVMHKAYQDMGNTYATDQIDPNQSIGAPEMPVQPEDQTKKPQQSQAVQPQTYQPHKQYQPQQQQQQQQPQLQPQQPSPIRVQLHESQRGAPQAPQRPEWSNPPQIQGQPFEDHHRSDVPHQRPFAQKPSDKPISHQKLAEQVAHKAIINYQAQQGRPRFFKPAPPAPHFANNEPQQGGAAMYTQPVQQPFETHTQNREYHDQRPDQWSQNQSRDVAPGAQPQREYDGNMPQSSFRAAQAVSVFSPENQPSEMQQEWQQATRLPKGPKSDDPTGWVVQDSVSANQMVKGAPWTRYTMEKQHRVWPPPSPKMCLVEKGEPTQYYCTTTSGPTTQNREEFDQWQPTAGAPYTHSPSSQQAYGSDRPPPPGQWLASPPQPPPPPPPPQSAPPTAFYRQPVTSGAQACATTPAAPFQPDQQFDRAQHFRPVDESRSSPLPHHQRDAAQQYGPVKPAIFNQYSTSKYATPVTAPQHQRAAPPVQQQRWAQPTPPQLHQPLTLDTQTEGTLYQQQQHSPRLLYKGGSFSPDDVTRAVPPSKPTTCTPVLPFTRQPDQQDFDKFHSLYSPVKMATDGYVVPESHQFVTNQVTCIPGGTSFARVQNVSHIDYDPQTGQPFKENITRVVRTTRTVPKWK